MINIVILSIYFLVKLVLPCYIPRIPYSYHIKEVNTSDFKLQKSTKLSLSYPGFLRLDQRNTIFSVTNSSHLARMNGHLSPLDLYFFILFQGVTPQATHAKYQSTSVSFDEWHSTFFNKLNIFVHFFARITPGLVFMKGV